MTEDFSDELRNAENTLRDFISEVFTRQYGESWIEKCGISEDKIAKWKERKKEESKRLGAPIETRLIYFAEFHDLKPIVRKQWGVEFSSAFGELKEFEVFFDILADYRNPDAHRRDLMPHQKMLGIGICRELRNRIIRYRSKKETLEDCFPRIERMSDSLGNVWESSNSRLGLLTNTTLRPGDIISFTVVASDPEGEPLKYRLNITPSLIGEWQSSNNFELKITEEHIGKSLRVEIDICSSRNYHAHKNYDDSLQFNYTVLPLKK